MKRLLPTLIIIATLLTFLSCSNNDNVEVLTGARANFTINTRLNDHHLNSAGNMGAYFPSSVSCNEYKQETTGVTSLQVFGRTPLAGSYYGVGGVLIINRGTYGNGPDFGAYDLACPYEAQKHIRIVANNDNKAVCPKCGSEFELFTGKVISGPALKKTKTLQYYFVRKIGEDEYRVIY